MNFTTLLIMRTARHRYATLHSDIAEMRLVFDPAALEAEGAFDRPCMNVELGPLLDPADHSRQRRRHALFIPLRRRYVALLVDSVETFLEQSDASPLPALLHEQLGQPWAIGALCYEDQPVVQIDLRAVARSAMLQLSPATDRKGNIIYVTGN